MDRTDRNKHYSDKSGHVRGFDGNLKEILVKKQDMNTSSSTEIAFPMGNIRWSTGRSKAKPEGSQGWLWGRCARLVKCKSILLWSFTHVHTEPCKFGERVRVAIGRRNSFPKTQGSLASEGNRGECSFLRNIYHLYLFYETMWFIAEKVGCTNYRLIICWGELSSHLEHKQARIYITSSNKLNYIMSTDKLTYISYMPLSSTF